MEALQKEFDFYKKHQAELVEKYLGKYLVIKDQAVIDAYGTREEAIQQSMQKYTLGTFLVQYVQSGDTGHTQTFHSRVLINARH